MEDNMRSSGLPWTEEEKQRLRMLINDNPDKKQTEIADIAIRYGMFPGRTKAALVTQICRMMKEEPLDDDQIDIFGVIAAAKYDELNRKYNMIMSAIIDAGTSFPQGNGLKLNYNAIMKCVFEIEPDRLARRIQELIEEREKQENSEEKKRTKQTEEDQHGKPKTNNRRSR